MDKELNVRGIVRPEISIRGEVQKGFGAGGAGMIMKTKAEWAELPTLKSIKGVWYVYTDWRQEEDPVTHEIINIPRAKIGDGETYVVDLPFTTAAITDEDIRKWNDHVGVIVDELTGSLIFYH